MVDQNDRAVACRSEEISSEDFRNAKDKMPMRDSLDDFLAEPFSEFDNSLLVARGAEVATLA